MSFRRLLATTLLSTLTLVLTATPAAAHAELIASDPAQDASVATAPAQVRLTFSEPVSPAPNVVEISGPGGARWTVGSPAVAGAEVTVPVQASGPAGAYTLVYRVISSDGDAVSGTIRFALTTPATPPTRSTTESTPTQPPAESEAVESEAVDTSAPAHENTAATGAEDGSGPPAWVWIVAAVALVAAGIVIALRVARSSSTRQPSSSDS
ncbi:copper resistance CopC family protein [Actinophytocola xanthii]|uniref:CopC domain-containing protein n=1 Tax=Actinophytocola xanthii TaxID=1912961 RepID=A0A1Q8CDY0_9PSEU|nr:copper resistance CopC family protein [Actinophytocola xanthii]OLF12584.1 hypothetical protein BU204_28485 [Actinophytocola xanthii]